MQNDVLLPIKILLIIDKLTQEESMRNNLKYLL